METNPVILVKNTGINLAIPVIAAGAFVGYHINNKSVRGAVIGGALTFAALIYADYKAWNLIGSQTEISPDAAKNMVIEPEYEVLNDE